MAYELRHFDTPLIRFEANSDSSVLDVNITWVNEEKIGYLPLGLDADAGSLASWLKHRTIPSNRAYVHSLLSKCGLSINRPMNIIGISKGLSLNDCYWVVSEDFDGRFDEYNLYDNRFSRILALIAFTGYGSSARSSLDSSPEFTTNGMLRKCWRREKGKIMLYKGATSGASNTGFEPYSEFYAAQVAGIMGIDAIPYGLSKWKGELCSVCELFTSKKLSYTPVGRIVRTGGMKAVREYYKTLGRKFTDALDDMLVFDALICNTDRHFGNFGLLIDNERNVPVSPAPLFDHGNSLFSLAGIDDLESSESLERYAKTLMPCVYDDFMGTAKSVLAKRHRDALRKIATVHLKRHSRYNLDDKRLALIEEQLHKRAKMLLDQTAK